MNTNEVKAAINAWTNIHHNGSAMVSKFYHKNSFAYTLPANTAGSTHVHVYPGIDPQDGELKFYVILSAYDKPSTGANVGSYVTECTAYYTVSGTHDRILSAEAHARVDRWIDNYQTWVPARAATTYGVYRAVSIPIQDFETNDVVIVLGLKLEPVETLGQKADMIVVNEMPNRHVYYDDYVQPVPPFYLIEQAQDFYLLQL